MRRLFSLVPVGHGLAKVIIFVVLTTALAALGQSQTRAPAPREQADRREGQLKALGEQIAKLKADHAESIRELEQIRALAIEEKAEQTAQRLAQLIATRQTQFKQRLQAQALLLEKLQGRRSAPAQQEQDQRTSKPLPTFADVHYGEHERQVLDFWKAQSEAPTPVVVYIHGGGFVGGDKQSIQPVVVNTCLESGISVAAIHYRFVTTHPFPAPQMDGARAIQFLRHKAKEWNIEPKRIAAYGGSAGAGISMFLAYHDDLAESASDDPVARQSSRLVAVGSFGGQTSYDPKVIKQWIGGRAYEHPSIFKCYNIKSVDEIDRPELQKVYDQVSAIKHVSADDPPIFMFYSEPDGDLPPDAKPGQGIHHPRFAYQLEKALDKFGVKYIYHHSSEFKGDPHLEMVKFLRSQFGT